MAAPPKSLGAIKIVTDDVAEGAGQLRLAAEILNKAAYLLERASYSSRGLGYDETATRLDQKHQAWTATASLALNWVKALAPGRPGAL